MSDLELAAADASPSVWTTIRQSLAGSHHGTYTDGPIGRAILLLAVPMVLELVLESVFAVVDVFFVSRLGADAVATVGLTGSMLTFVYAIAIGLSVGAMATVARRIGEGDADGAARAAVQAIALGLIVAAPLGVFGALYAPQLLSLMGATPAVLEHSSFAVVVFGANGVIMMLFLINAVSAGFPFYAAGYVLTQSFNGAGDTLTPTLINILCLWLGELPLAYLLATSAGFGPAGVFWAIAIAFSAMSFVSAAVFRRGKWKNKKV